MSRKIKSSRRPGKNGRMSSGLDQHKRKGKLLVAPFNSIGSNIRQTSWRDERLPDVLWIALLVRALPRERCLELFRAMFVQLKALNQDLGPTHTDFAKLNEQVFDTLLHPLLTDSKALYALAPLLVLQGLPDRHHWLRHLPIIEIPNAFQALADAVAITTDHQSQEATDCRWVIVMFHFSLDRVHTGKFSEEFAEIADYPYRGDQRAVRPTIRAMELAMSLSPAAKRENEWPKAFWKESFAISPCIIARHKEVEPADTKAIAEALGSIYFEAINHFHRTLTTTDVDARHDAVFGLVLYGINLAITMNQGMSHLRVQGRLAIRTLVECVIVLTYLVKRDEEGLWKKYRSYGTGQAKLNLLKMIDLDDTEMPAHTSLEELERLANEDMWQELVDINLGNWAGSDLRRISEEAGIKSIYDKYYGWPSGYVHGQWGAVRDTVFGQCLNPLHRFHRVPTPPRLDMGSVGGDSAKLVNLLLDLLNAAYPSFKFRVSAKSVATDDGEKPS